jgi:hypothetical protein
MAGDELLSRGKSDASRRNRRSALRKKSRTPLVRGVARLLPPDLHEPGVIRFSGRETFGSDYNYI